MNRDPIVLGISGGSGSGKSRFARRIQSAFNKDSTLIEQDWYYRDLSYKTPGEAAKTNFDHPSAIEHTLLYQHLNHLIQGREVGAPDYCYANYNRLDSINTLKPNPLLIVEGLFSLYWPKIRDLFDLKLYIEVNVETRLERRLLRDSQERGYSKHQIQTSWDEQTLPMHSKFVEPTAQFADFIWESQEDTTFETTFLADLRRRLAKNAKNPK